MDLGGPNFPSQNVKITPINPSLRYRPDPQIGGQNRQGGGHPHPPPPPPPARKTVEFGGVPPGGVYRCNFDKKGGEGVFLGWGVKIDVLGGEGGCRGGPGDC